MNYTIPSTTNSVYVFPTLAWQLANASPLAALIIHEALFRMPSIADVLGMEQGNDLFVEPLCAIAQEELGTTTAMRVLTALLFSRYPTMLIQFPDRSR